jgi:hypothetical protein
MTSKPLPAIIKRRRPPCPRTARDQRPSRRTGAEPRLMLAHAIENHLSRPGVRGGSFKPIPPHPSIRYTDQNTIDRHRSHVHRFRNVAWSFIGLDFHNRLLFLGPRGQRPCLISPPPAPLEHPFSAARLRAPTPHCRPPRGRLLRLVGNGGASVGTTSAGEDP